MPQSSTHTVTKPAVLENRYPVYDSAGNKCQFVRLRFFCGHVEEFYSLDLGRTAGYKWKPRTNRQLMDEHLRITCPIGFKLCRDCSEHARRNAETVARLDAQLAEREAQS